MKSFSPSKIFIFLLILSHLSCKKEIIYNGTNEYLQLEIDGNKMSIEACGTSSKTFEFKDTSAFTAFGCNGTSIGFLLRGKNIDGTYELGKQHLALFETGYVEYETDSFNHGILQIKTGQIRMPSGALEEYVEGFFEFEAIASLTSKKVKIKNGHFILKKRYF